MESQSQENRLLIVYADGGEYFQNFFQFFLQQLNVTHYDIIPLSGWTSSRGIPDVVLFSHFGNSRRKLETVLKRETLKQNQKQNQNQNQNQNQRKMIRVMFSGEPLELGLSESESLDLVIDTKLWPHLRKNLPRNCSVCYIPFCITNFWERWIWSPEDLETPKKKKSMSPGMNWVETRHRENSGLLELWGKQKEQQLKIQSQTLDSKRFCAFLYERPVSFRNDLFYALCKYKTVDDLGLQPSGHKTCIERKGFAGIDAKEQNYFDASVKLYSSYKFVVAVENSFIAGYVTEKIVSALLAGTIPIYYGPSEISRLFNRKRFINVADFTSFEACVEFVAKIDQDETLYQAIISEPCLHQDFKNDAKTWVNSFVSPVLKELGRLLNLNLNLTLKLKDFDLPIPLSSGIQEKRVRPQVHFLSFGSGIWEKSLDRIVKEAEEWKIFDWIYRENQKSLFEHKKFLPEHKVFIQKNKFGFGYYFWKSFLVWQTLTKMKEGDILLYCDAGCLLRPVHEVGIDARRNKLYQYLEQVQDSPSGILCFQLNGSRLIEYAYTKRKTFLKVLEKCKPETEKKQMKREEEFGMSKQIMATTFFIRKCPASERIVELWYELCCSEAYSLVDDSSSSEYPEIAPFFVEHRRDQSIWSLLCKIKGASVIQDETYWYPAWEKAGNDYPIWAARRAGQ